MHDAPTHFNEDFQINPMGMFDKEKYLREMSFQGYSIVEGLLQPDFIKRAKKELEFAIDQEARYHGNTAYSDYGMVLLCALYGGSFLELFDNKVLVEAFDAYLGDGCIAYAYTSSSMPPGKTNYSKRIHVDCPRLIPGYATNMGVTIALDDFTDQNGATWFLPSSHTQHEKPSESEFYANARRLIVPAGSAFFFNARLWHAGGDNLTSDWRHALTLNMCRPYMKQRIDIPRAMSSIDLSNVSSVTKQKLGFYSQVPASYEEYYAPQHLRKFTQSNE